MYTKQERDRKVPEERKRSELIAGVQGSFNNADEVEHIIENAMMNISGINGIFVVSGGQEGVVEAFESSVSSSGHTL